MTDAMPFMLLPKILHPLKMANSQFQLKGKIEVKNLQRLCEVLINDHGKVLISLDFLKDEGGRALISGHLQAKLELQCQRCFEAMQYEHEASFKLAPVFSIEQAKQLPGALEPLLLEQDQVELAQIVEDEILLALPIIPKHPENECKVLIEKEKQKKAFKKDNPFGKLSKLKK